MGGSGDDEENGLRELIRNTPPGHSFPIVEAIFGRSGLFQIDSSDVVENTLDTATLSLPRMRTVWVLDHRW